MTCLWPSPLRETTTIARFRPLGLRGWLMRSRFESEGGRSLVDFEDQTCPGSLLTTDTPRLALEEPSQIEGHVDICDSEGVPERRLITSDHRFSEVSFELVDDFERTIIRATQEHPVGVGCVDRPRLAVGSFGILSTDFDILADL